MLDISTWVVIATLLGGVAALVALLKDGASLVGKRDGPGGGPDSAGDGGSADFIDPLAGRFENVAQRRKAVGLGTAVIAAAAVEAAHHHGDGAAHSSAPKAAGDVGDSGVDTSSGADFSSAADWTDGADAADAGGGLVHLLEGVRTFFTH